MSSTEGWGEPQMTPLLREYLAQQDSARGNWPSPRPEAEMPEWPYPHPDNVMLQYLIALANRSLRQGVPVDQVMMHLAVHAWFEGGVEGYDQGRHDAEDEGVV